MRSAWIFTALALVLGVTSCQGASEASPAFAPSGESNFTLDFRTEEACNIVSESFGDVYCKGGELHVIHTGRAGENADIASFYFYHEYEPPSAARFENLMLEAEMRSVDGRGAYGVQFRAPDTDLGYAFVVQPTGDFRLIGGLAAREVLPWTRSGAIHKGESANLLQIRAEGTELRLYVNGSQVATVQDKALKDGWTGVVAMENAHVVVSRFAVWRLP